MKMSATCDAYNYVNQLYKELESIYSEIELKFPSDAEISTIFRLLRKTIERKTRTTFTKADLVLGIDFFVYHEDYYGHAKCEQRHMLSKDYPPVLYAAVEKYKEQLGVDDVQSFVSTFEAGLHRIGWRKEDWEVAMEAAGM
ncbi:hypothetical protein [Pelomonas sp. KK5]|uniref:hypothetical protein n=1 Tax=Pelomonas sp. KK5 TaxID=1855730 RepID=UPI00118111B4|nr:hypothetical protein [Pelomonas sp. KK5]